MRTHPEPARDVPVAGKYDVIVVGGGPAGVAASLASARGGARTLVIEQFNCLGGVATAGGHAHMSKYDEWGGRGRRVVGGIADEVATALVDDGCARRTPHGVWFEIERLKLILDRLAGQAGVDVLYHSFFCEAIVADGAARGVVVQNKSGRQAFLAGRVIDCTGDGDVGVSAGCPWEMGRPADGRCQPVTLMFTIGGVDYDRVTTFIEAQPGPRAWQLENVWAEAQANGDMEPFQKCTMGWWWTPSRPDWLGVNFTHVIHVDSTRAADLTRATIEARRQAYHTLDVYRKYIPGMEHCYMVSTPNTIGIRESRRILGDYVLTEDDVRGQRTFPDTIGYGSFFVDIHAIDGPGMDTTSWRPPEGFKYQIPHRILLPRGCENLLVAGRCVSCTHVALGSIRVMVQCMVMGEAAGTAAAISVADGVSPRAVDVGRLQSALRAGGAILDEEDIARANAE